MESISEYLRRQKEFSEKAFGPGRRTEGILKHITKEMAEVRENPLDPMEWIDIAILALDGAWRTGASPNEVTGLLIKKQEINIKRTYPFPVSEDDISEHDRSMKE